VVLVLLASSLLIVGLLLGGVCSVREAAERAKCQGRLKQLALAAHNYESTYGAFPPGTISNPALTPEQRLSWLMAIHPFLESSPVYRQTDKMLAWDADGNKPTTHINCPYFVCPKAPDQTTINTSYVGVAGVGPDAATLSMKEVGAGVFGYDRKTRIAEIGDGAADTMLVLETSIGRPWAQGGPGTVKGLDPADRPHLGAGRSFGSSHAWEKRTFSPSLTGANVAMADGSVRFVRDSIAPEVLEALATINGKDAVRPVSLQW
jgi:prepilin-type processing-associated H-X9-DG protein